VRPRLRPVRSSTSGGGSNEPPPRSNQIYLLALVFDRVAVAVCVFVGVPPVADTVSVYDPLATEEGTETVRLEVLPVVEVGLNVALAPEGTPLTEKVSEAVNAVRLIVTL